MLKKLVAVIAVVMVMMGSAFAQVDVNKADQAALDGIKGIGPAKSKAILDERKKGGDFKDWTDFEERVKGIGSKNAEKLSEAGLTINGKPKSKTTATATEGKKEKVMADTDKGVTAANTKAKDLKSESNVGKDTKAGDGKEVKKEVPAK